MSLSFARLEQLDERTNYIVFGFIRNIQKRLLQHNIHKNMPKLIQYICLLYVDDYFMMDHGRYIWEVTDKLMICKMFEAKVGEKYESEMFEVGKLKWILKAYPNGYNSIHHGSFKLYLKLLSIIPNEWKNIVICIRTRCPQINLLYTSIKIIKKDSRIPLWSNATLLLKDIIKLNPHRLTFEINIKILRILLNKPANKIFYQFELAYNKKQHLLWKLDHNNLDLQSWHSCRMGSSYESKIFDNMWCITICPNSNKGNVILCLQLICLPSNISKLKVKYTLKCNEYQSTNVKMYSYEQGKSYGLWSASKSLSFEQFKLYDSISLSCDIVILDEYDSSMTLSDDYDGQNAYVCDEYIQQYWLQYIKQKEYFQEISNSYYDHKYYNLEQKLNQISKDISILSATMQSFIQLHAKNGFCRHDKSQKKPKNDKIWLWLKNCVGLENYYDLFIDNGLDDLDILSCLRMNDLISIGIDKLGHRIKIMKCIAALVET